MNRKKILTAFLAVLVLWMTFTVNATALSGVPAGLDQTKPAAAAPEVIRLPPGWQLTRMPRGPFRTEMALAPDGSFLVFSASPDGTMAKAMLFRRSLDREEADRDPGHRRAMHAVLLSRRPVDRVLGQGKTEQGGGEGWSARPNLRSQGSIPFGICWGSDGRIIFGTLGSGLGYVSAAGGTPETLTTLDAGKEATHRLPHLLPGGKVTGVYLDASQFGVEARIEWLSLETGKRKVLIEDGADARYVSTGHLIFVRRGTLMAAPFSLDRLETTGPAVTVNAGLMQAFNASMADWNSGAGQYSVSESGSLISVSGGIFPEPVADLYWVDRSGRAEKWTAFGTRPVMGIRLSPDGRQLAFTTGGLNRGVWIYDIQRNTVTRLTSDGQPWGSGLDAGRETSGLLLVENGPFGDLVGGGGRQRKDGATDKDRIRTTGKFLDAGWQVPRFCRLGSRNGLGHPGASDGGPAGHSLRRHQVESKPFPSSPPTAAGWPMRRTNRDATRFTFVPFQTARGRCRFPARAARPRCGRRMGGSFSTGTSISRS